MTGGVAGAAAAMAPRTAWRALTWYALLTVAMTWPVVTSVASRVPSDLGDPLLNCWIIGWNTHHFARALGGDWAALRELWHGNMFHPERYTLAYSELLITQSLQALPIVLASDNLVLSHNLLFLSTFVLSGLGMFLLVRAMAGDWRVAFVAGALYAFAPYRLSQASHLQVMSSQWMPFALLGFHRAAATGRLRPAIGGAAALVAQNLSCGYFLVYFSLFVPPFVVFEIARHRRLADWRTWAVFAAAAALVGAATLPFMSPYLALRELRDTVRQTPELEFFSADTWGWFTAPTGSTLWGGVLTLRERPEGSLFQGVVPLVLAVLGVILGWRRARQATTVPSGAATPRAGTALRPARTGLQVFGAVLTVAGTVGLLTILAGGSGLHHVLGFRVRIESGTHSLRLLAGGLALLVASWPRLRRTLAHAAVSPVAFAAAATIVAAYLTLGPVPRAAGQPIQAPPVYLWLLDVVPGLDGLRVPARFAAVAVLFLSIVASGGVRHLLRLSGRRAGLVAALVLAAVLVDAAMLPVPLGEGERREARDGLRLPPPTLPIGRDAPRIYQAVRNLPPDAVLLEMPLGPNEWEFRHIFYSTLHWRRMVNGYSGYIPQSYAVIAGAVQDPYRDPELAWQRVEAAGITHVVVHGDGYVGVDPPAPYAWLEANGAVPIAVSGADRLYELRR